MIQECTRKEIQPCTYALEPGVGGGVFVMACPCLPDPGFTGHIECYCALTNLASEPGSGTCTQHTARSTQHTGPLMRRPTGSPGMPDGHHCIYLFLSLLITLIHVFLRLHGRPCLIRRWWTVWWRTLTRWSSAPSALSLCWPSPPQESMLTLMSTQSVSCRVAPHLGHQMLVQT